MMWLQKISRYKNKSISCSEESSVMVLLTFYMILKDLSNIMIGNFFGKMQNSSHCLNHILSETRPCNCPVRNAAHQHSLTLPRTKTSLCRKFLSCVCFTSLVHAIFEHYVVLFLFFFLFYFVCFQLFVDFFLLM